MVYGGISKIMLIWYLDVLTHTHLVKWGFWGYPNSLTGAERREWMGMGVAGIIIDDYGLDHSLIPYV